MSIPNVGKETTINWNEAEDTASIFTMSPSMQRRLAALAKEFPDDVVIHKIADDYGVEYVVPKKLIKLRRPLKLSEKSRAERAEMARIRFWGNKHQSENDTEV